MKILFTATDPGGYDVIFPVYSKMKKEIKECRLLLMEPASFKSPEYSCEKNDLLPFVDSFLQKGDILVTGTGWKNDSERNAVILCREKGIKTVSILDYWNNYVLRFRAQDGTVVFPDYYFMMDETAENEAVKEGVDPSIIRIVGHPGLDYFIHKKINLSRAAGIVFLSSPVSELYGKKLGYTEFEATEDIINICRRMDIPFSIKFHPKDTIQYKKQYSCFSAEGQMEDLVSKYKIIISTYSVALLQCWLMGASVISYQPHLKSDDMCITNKLGITEGIYTKEDLEHLLKDGNTVRKDIEGPEWLDGNSTDRCVRMLTDIIETTYTEGR